MYLACFSQSGWLFFVYTACHGPLERNAFEPIVVSSDMMASMLFLSNSRACAFRGADENGHRRRTSACKTDGVWELGRGLRKTWGQGTKPGIETQSNLSTSINDVQTRTSSPFSNSSLSSSERSAARFDDADTCPTAVIELVMPDAALYSVWNGVVCVSALAHAFSTYMCGPGCHKT